MAASGDDQNRIVDVRLDERTLVRRRPEIEHERQVAIFDLLDQNHFRVADDSIHGPYTLHLAIDGDKLTISVNDQADQPLLATFLAVRAFRSVIRDYFLICESYFGAIRTASPSHIEAIDMGRRGLHNEGAAMLSERLGEKGIEVDTATARRLFTLVCVLHMRG